MMMYIKIANRYDAIFDIRRKKSPFLFERHVPPKDQSCLRGTLPIRNEKGRFVVQDFKFTK